MNSVRDYQGQERERRYGLLRAIMGVIALLFSPLPFSSLARLLQVQEQGIQRALDDIKHMH
jgi:hypothetical protein